MVGSAWRVWLSFAVVALASFGAAQHVPTEREVEIRTSTTGDTPIPVRVERVLPLEPLPPLPDDVVQLSWPYRLVPERSTIGGSQVVSAAVTPPYQAVRAAGVMPVIALILDPATGAWRETPARFERARDMEVAFADLPPEGLVFMFGNREPNAVGGRPYPLIAFDLDRVVPYRVWPGETVVTLDGITIDATAVDPAETRGFPIDVYIEYIDPDPWVGSLPEHFLPDLGPFLTFGAFSWYASRTGTGVWFRVPLPERRVVEEAEIWENIGTPSAPIWLPTGARYDPATHEVVFNAPTLDVSSRAGFFLY